MSLDYYLKKFHLKPFKIEPIVHEESLSSLVYKLHLKNDSFAILKISYDHKRFRRESYFLNLLRDAIQVPKLIATVQPKRDLKGALLMEYLPGELASLAFNEKKAFEMGRLLAKLHCIPCRFYGDIAENTLPLTYENGLVVLRSYFYESLSECRKILSKALLSNIEKYVEKTLKEIKSFSPCICHRDFKPGNVLFFQDEIKGLIDWEIARMGFIEEDIATMQYFVWNEDSKTKESFFKGYGSVKNLPGLELLQLMVIRKALGALGFSLERKSSGSLYKEGIEKSLGFLEKFFE